jgi:hypothetical protein
MRNWTRSVRKVNEAALTLPCGIIMAEGKGTQRRGRNGRANNFHSARWLLSHG